MQTTTASTVHEKLLGKRDEVSLGFNAKLRSKIPHLRIKGCFIGKELDIASAGVSVCAASIYV